MNDTQTAANPLVRCYELFTRCANRLQSFALLALRIGIGFGLWFSAYGHLTHVDRMVNQFMEWGIPFPKFNVYMSGLTEAVGGILLILGLGTRFISIPLFFNFVVAYATASKDEFRQLLHLKDGGTWSAWGDIVNDSAMPFLVSALVTLAFGAGKYSLDYLLARNVFRVTGDETPERPGFTAAPAASSGQRQFQ